MSCYEKNSKVLSARFERANLSFILVTKFVEYSKHHFCEVYYNCAREVFFLIIILKRSLIQLGGYFSKNGKFATKTLCLRLHFKSVIDFCL